MCRFQQVNQYIKEKQKELNLNSSEQREVMHLALLAQISETFGMYLDVYSATHGVQLREPVEEENKKNNLKEIAKKRGKNKKDDEPIPDSEIPFASDE